MSKKKNDGKEVKLTNAKFANVEPFTTACEMVGIPNTSRQASKFRNKKGLAFKVLDNQIEVQKDNDGNFLRILNQEN